MNNSKLAPNATSIGQELLAQGDWLRGLARSLVSDADLADDLVQETSLSALRSKPSTTGGLRSWLSTVMRNDVRSRVRDERKRRWREQVASRMDNAPSASYVVERASVQQRVVACVMGLGEPYRQTILLRYLDELSPAAIAAQMRVPVSTVKSRLSRGMEQLRARMDSNHEGDREAWLSGVAAIAQVEGRSWFWKSGIAAGVLTLGAGGAWLTREYVFLEPRVAANTDLPLVLPEALVSERVEIASAPVVESNEVEARVSDASDRKRNAPTKRTFVGNNEPPPGLLAVPAGEAWAEGDYDDVEAQFLSALGANSPLYRWIVEMRQRGGHVDAFHMMPTEVTNEQYYEFVKRTGARPPISWAGVSLRSYEKDRDRRRLSFRTRETIFGRTDLDAEAWWDEQWKLVNWKMPKDIAHLPVVGVNQSEAQAYAAWAGLRLPNVLEYVRASLVDDQGVKRRSKRTKRDEPVSIKSMEDPGLEDVGAYGKGNGFYDLFGNAREWVQTSFELDEAWSVQDLEQELSQLTGGLPLTANSEMSWPFAGVGRDVAPMSLLSGTSATDVSVELRGNALGFRCAASDDPRLDLARTVLARISAEDWPSNARGKVIYSPEKAIGLHRWKTGRGTRRMKLDDYAVIEEFEHVQFIPVSELPAATLQEVRKPAGAYSPLHLGLLSTNLDLAEPRLPAGTYSIVMWRSVRDPYDRTPPEGLSATKDRVVFIRVGENTEKIYGGPTRAVLPAWGLEFSLATPDNPPAVVEARDANDSSNPETVDRSLELPLSITTSVSRDVKLTLVLRFADGVLAGDWRSRR